MNTKIVSMCLMLILIALIFLSCNPQQNQTDEDITPYLKELYVGSSQSDKFHKVDCKWAKTIKPENEVYFTYDEAIKAGFKPCKTCNPKPE